MIPGINARPGLLHRRVLLAMVARAMAVIAKCRSFSTALLLINMVSVLFRRTLSEYYSVKTALQLSAKVTGRQEPWSGRQLILTKLISRYLSLLMFSHDWKTVSALLEKVCHLSDADLTQAKLLLCTHTGDYWLTILTLARQYQDMDYDFLVPIFEEITEKNARNYNLIAIPGVRISFININAPGALIKIARYLREPNKVVAVFYDLPCYVAGNLTGAVEPVTLFNKKGHMTTGIIKLAIKRAVCMKLVSNRYNEASRKFTVTTAAVIGRQQDEINHEMVGFLERYVKETPWQWHFISTLDTYYHFPLIALYRKNEKEMRHFTVLNNKYRRTYD